MALIKDIAIGMSVNTKGFAKDLAQADKLLAKFGLSTAKIGKTLASTFGAITAGSSAIDALKASVGTAVKLEKSLTALSKASDLEGAGLASLKDELFSLSTEIKGVPIDDLLAIATSGSKMGIAADEIVEYTRGVAMLSTAMDDIPAETVADQVGKINVVFKLGTKGAMQLGSAVDKLADSGASSAADIFDVTQRLAGTAKAMNLTADQTIALAAALLDTGTKAERGATALDKLLNALVKVENHGDFAKAIGVDVATFSKQVATEPIKAIQSFLAALKKLDASAQSSTLESIGVKADGAEAEIKKLAQQEDELAAHLRNASNEFKTQNQILQSYAKSAATTDAAWVTYQNHIDKLSETLGSTLLPAINSALGAMGSQLEEANNEAKSLQEAFDTISQFKLGSLGSLGSSLANVGTAMGPTGGALTAAGGLLGDKSGATSEFTRFLTTAAKAAGPAGGAFGAIGKLLGPGFAGAATPWKDSDPKAMASARAKAQAKAENTRQAAQAVAEENRARSAKEEAKAAKAKAKEEAAAKKKADAAKKKAEATALKAALELKEQGQSVIESTRTPMEQYKAKLGELNTLLGAKAIDSTTFKRATEAARKDIFGGDEPQFAGAFQRGSAEAYSAQLRFGAQGQSRDEPIKEVAKQAPKQTDLLRQVVTGINRIADRAGAKTVELFTGL